MSARTHIAAAALALTFATIGQASAADGRFYVLPVIGAAFQNHSIAIDPDQVRRQGGFDIPAAVRWLPAAPTGADVSCASAQEPMTLKALGAVRMLTPDQLRRRDETRANLERSTRISQEHREAALH